MYIYIYFTYIYIYTLNALTMLCPFPLSVCVCVWWFRVVERAALEDALSREDPHVRAQVEAFRQSEKSNI
jgi:hypothetical protein